MVDVDMINVVVKIIVCVVELKVCEGDCVQFGQVLFLFDSFEVVVKEQQVYGVLVVVQVVVDKVDEGVCSEDICVVEVNWKWVEVGVMLVEVIYWCVQNLFNEGVMIWQKCDEVYVQVISLCELVCVVCVQYDMVLVGVCEQDKCVVQGQVQQVQGVVVEVNVVCVEVEGCVLVVGEINKCMVDLGELVLVGYFVFILVDIDCMWVVMNLCELQMQGLKVGSRLQGSVLVLGLDGEFEVYFINLVGDYVIWCIICQLFGYDVCSFEVWVCLVCCIEGFCFGMSVLFVWFQY